MEHGYSGIIKYKGDTIYIIKTSILKYLYSALF